MAEKEKKYDFANPPPQNNPFAPGSSNKNNPQPGNVINNNPNSGGGGSANKNVRDYVDFSKTPGMVHYSIGGVDQTPLKTADYNRLQSINAGGASYGRDSGTITPEMNAALLAQYGKTGEVTSGTQGVLVNEKKKKEEQKRADTASAAIAQIGDYSQIPGASPGAPGFGSIIPDVLANVGSNAGKGAALGAAAGLTTGGTLSAPLAGVGAATGVVTGLFTALSSLKEEAIQDTKITYTDFVTSANGLKAAIQYAKDGGDPLLAVEMYNNELARIDKAERDLNALSESDWLTKSKDELTKLNAFNRYSRTKYNQMLQLAIEQNPDAQFDFSALDALNVPEMK